MSSDSGDDLMAELGLHFRETSAIRVREMAALLKSLEGNAEEREALDQLVRHFHAMSGLGATYGFPRISQLGEVGEEASLALQRSGKPVTPELLARWRELVEAVARELAQ